MLEITLSSQFNIHLFKFFFKKKKQQLIALSLYAVFWILFDVFEINNLAFVIYLPASKLFILRPNDKVDTALT